MHQRGEPVKGEAHVADASTATAVPIFNVGSYTARTLVDGELIRIESVEVVTNTAADVNVFIGPTNVPAAGKTIIRGSFAANGGIAATNIDVAGNALDTVWVLSSAAAIVDVNFKGSVHNEQGTKLRPSWRESTVPGQ